MKTNFSLLGKEYHLEKVDRVYDEISKIDFSKSLSDQINYLDEDLFQLIFTDGDILDLGWYPSFDEEGKFIIQLIFDGDWDSPVVKYTSGWNKKELIDKLNSILDIKNSVQC